MINTMESDLISFSFQSPLRKSSPGSPSLRMVIRESLPEDDTGTHELKEVKMPVALNTGYPEDVTLTHPWIYSGHERVCAGHIVLKELTGERKIAFSLGGDLFCNPAEDQTIFTLKSSAPILRLENFNQTPMILADEIAIQLAEMRAEKHAELDEYQRNLTCADPFMLYCICLNLLRDKFHGISYHESPILFNFLTDISEEIRSLKLENNWPEPLPELEDLLFSSQ